MVEPLQRGGLVRQNTFTKETGIQAIQRPTTTEESKARLVTSSYNRKSLDASSWSRGQVSLVGGRIVRRASGDQKMLISPGSIRKHSGLIADNFEQNLATTTSEHEKITSEKPKLVRRRTWTKDEDTAQTKVEGYESSKQSSLVSSGGRVVVTKQKDNLYLEGEIIQKIPEKWEPGQRAAVIKQKDNLSLNAVKDTKGNEAVEDYKQVSTVRQNYQFEIPEVKAWAPGERSAVIKRNDNIQMSQKSEQLKHSVATERMEVDKQIDKVMTRTEKTEAVKLDSKKRQNGQFEVSRNEWADREDMEGQFASKRVESSEKWIPGERAVILKREDNLKMEGSFEARKQEKWLSGQKVEVIKHNDNLKQEGDFIKRSSNKWSSGERAKLIKQNSNLKSEGDFEAREVTKWLPGERSKVIKRDDNLFPEGSFEKRSEEQWIATEKAKVVKRDDNLHPEGEFHKRPDQVWAPGDRANVIRRDDNLQPEGDFSKRPDATWAPGL